MASKEDYYIQKGTLLAGQGKLVEAKRQFTRALKIDSKSAMANYNMALVYFAQGNLVEAEKKFKIAVEQRENFIEALSNLGVVYRYQNKPEKAKRMFKKIVELDPTNLIGIIHLSSILIAEKRYEEADRYLRKAPQTPDILCDRGSVALAKNNMSEAEKFYKKSLILDPNHLESNINLSQILVKQDDFPQAIGYIKRSLEADPANCRALSLWVYYLRETCDWSGLGDAINRLDAAVELDIENKVEPGERPLMYLARVNSARKNLELTSLYSSEAKKNVGAHTRRKLRHRTAVKKKRRIRIGYVSSNFADHPVGKVIKDLFRLHSKDKFEVFGYSLNMYKDDYTEIISGFDKYVDLSDYHHSVAAEKIKRDKIDILIDLNGYTDGSKPEIFAHRPAPIQVNYLGFIGSMGSDFHDYIIVDKIIVPKNQAKYYTEKLVYMPDCYQVNSLYKLSPKKTRRDQHGLPDREIVFSSFNRPSKITPDMFASWMRILKQTKGSVLWLFEHNLTAKNNLTESARSLGVSPKRLVFAKRVLFEKHINRLRLSDIGLDTSAYNGGATTSHSLNAGVPVVTLQGKTYISRMSSSIVAAVGLSELVAKNLDEYEKLAISLATDHKKLDAVRHKLNTNKLTYPLYDTKSFTFSLESAYVAMYQRYANNKKPDHIEV